MDKQLLYAVATMTGMIIGAGTLAIPYVVAKSGLLVGLLHILVIGLFMLLLNLYVGEVVLRTKEAHQLPGYAEVYLGRWGKLLMMFCGVVGSYAALTAYLIAEGNSFSALFGGNSFFYSLIFYVGIISLVYSGIKTIEKSELLFSIGKIVILLFLCLLLIPFFKIKNITVFNESFFFLPFGTMLFAYIGAFSIPSVGEILIHKKKMMYKAIIIGSVIPILVYGIFAFVVVGSLGSNTSEVATAGFGMFGFYLHVIGNIFAILTMITAFLSISLSLVEMFHLDYHIDRRTSFVLVASIPLFLFLLGVKNFIKVLSVAGISTGALGGILVILMYWNARKTHDRIPEYSLVSHKVIGWIIIFLFLAGSIWTLFTLF